jgi:hypothetical protein
LDLRFRAQVDTAAKSETLLRIMSLFCNIFGGLFPNAVGMVEWAVPTNYELEISRSPVLSIRVFLTFLKWDLYYVSDVINLIYRSFLWALYLFIKLKHKHGILMSIIYSSIATISLKTLYPGGIRTRVFCF